jgi:hypothetical protein
LKTVKSMKDNLEGIRIRTCVNPIITKSMIHSFESCGIRVYRSGKGVIEECDIYENKQSRVSFSRSFEGIFVDSSSGGMIKDCDFSGIKSHVSTEQGSRVQKKNFYNETITQ